MGVELSLREYDLVIVDCETGVEQLTKADSEELAREQAEYAQTQERQEKQQEQAARIAAEKRIRELEEELRRLRNGNS